MDRNYEEQDYLADLLAGRTEKWYCPYIKDGKQIWQRYYSKLPVINPILRDETFEEWTRR